MVDDEDEQSLVPLCNPSEIYGVLVLQLYAYLVFSGMITSLCGLDTSAGPRDTSDKGDRIGTTTVRAPVISEIRRLLTSYSVIACSVLSDAHVHHAILTLQAPRQL